MNNKALLASAVGKALRLVVERGVPVTSKSNLLFSHQESLGENQFEITLSDGDHLFPRWTSKSLFFFRDDLLIRLCAGGVLSIQLEDRFLAIALVDGSTILIDATIADRCAESIDRIYRELGGQFENCQAWKGFLDDCDEISTIALRILGRNQRFVDFDLSIERMDSEDGQIVAITVGNQIVFVYNLSDNLLVYLRNDSIDWSERLTQLNFSHNKTSR